MNYEEEALHLLEKYEDWGQHHFVFWSGGKDSTAALHLALTAWDSNPPKVAFVDTGITLPETLDYVKKLSKDWGFRLIVLKADLDFWQYVTKNGFPNVKALWCRRLLKMKPIKKFISEHKGWKVQVLGIRKAESPARQKSPFYDRPFRRHTKLPFTFNLLPLLDWTDNQVEEYMSRVQIPVNPAYKEYSTSGCYWCPFVRSNQHYMSLKKNHPELFDKIVFAEKVSRKGHTPWPQKSIIPLVEQESLALNGAKTI
jgi:3'-phosphoadenosine 5'-phosphosulfate sulfotransferase (PAPS reductase)/FAD synthetase